ncbi:hypothetical protein [Chitinophaga sp. 212800010-3]|uniref:hypothetical protein n=1 Tax=unclassified Chitinophaga TaxID=2619133 RepID=UPI002DE8C367|nr:hypothetical protein [Chitinophaga sp. 212800010-3]
MNDAKKPAGKHLKKEAGLKIATILSTALIEFKDSLGEKKFLRNIKKASKAMVAGLSDKKTHAKPKKKAAAKKATAPAARKPKAAAKKAAAPKKAAAKKA